MNKHTRPLREAWCQGANLYFLERLNKQPRNAAVQRVARIIELLINADQLRAKIYKAEFSQVRSYASTKEHRYTSLGARKNKLRTGFTFSDPAINRMNRQYEQCLIELERLLKRYRWRPVVVDFNYWNLEQIFHFGAKSDDEFWENNAVRWILSNLETGFQLAPSKLSRVRRCRDCSRWFAAKTDHQHFCGESCRKRFASQSSEFKAKRRDYMRDRYRPMQKEAEQRSLRNARSNAKGKK